MAPFSQWPVYIGALFLGLLRDLPDAIRSWLGGAHAAAKLKSGR